MRKKYYLPRPLNKRAQWLNSFSKAFEDVGPVLGYSAEKVQSVKQDAAMVNWLVKVQAILRNTRKSFTAFKLQMNEGAAGSENIAVPQLPALPPAPSPVPPGIFKRLRKLVQQIKTNKDYNKAIGEKLDIVGTERKIDVNKAQPKLTLKFVAGKLEVHWKKDVFTGIDIYINKNDGNGFVLTTTDLRSPAYIKIELPEGQATALWQVMGIYKQGDQPVGLPSAIVEVAVRQSLI